MSSYTVFGYQQSGSITLNPNICVITDANGALLSSNISSEVLSYLNGLTGNIQTQLSACPQISTPLTNNRVLISTGTNSMTTSSISTTTLGYLDATSSIQTQLNGKQSTISLNNNIVPITNGSGALASSSVSATTLGYLDATSSVQTQLNSKMALLSGLTSGDYIKATGTGTIGNATVLSESGSNLSVAGSLNLTPAADGSIFNVNNHSGTEVFQINSSTGFVSSLMNLLVDGHYGTPSTTAFEVTNNSNQSVFTVDNSTPQINIGTNAVPYINNVYSLGASGAAFSKLWTQNANIGSLTVSTALVSDSSNNIISSSTTSTELGYVHGVTSSIQTQLNGKQASLSGLTSGDHLIASGSNTIANSSILSESGGTLTANGTVSVNGNLFVVDKLLPNSTACTIGDSSSLWGSVWATNGTIQTSDINQKTNVVASTLGLNFINQLQPKQWNWNNGLDNDTHFGLVYQDLDALDTNNNFGFLHESDGSATGTHGLVYTELIGPMIAAIQTLSTQVTALQTQVTALNTT